MAKPEHLLERMRQSPFGWRRQDIRRVYRGAGFEETEGEKHTLFRHPRHRALRATVSRASGSLPSGYARKAVELVDKAARLDATQGGSR